MSNISGTIRLTTAQALSAGVQTAFYKGDAAYLHIRYAPNANPTDGEMTDTANDFVGFCANHEQTAPTTAGSYSWARISWARFDINNLEKGVHDAHLAFSTFLQWFLNFRRWLEDRNVEFSAEFSSEVKSVALTNSAHFPFNNSKQTVALTTARNTLNYNVTYEIVSANGSVGDVQITDKQLNGFKIAFDGSATAVTIKVRIQGGMLV